tara:strand:- start:688 stop:1242 length:555 start_codon:yes stop_codon:yes gene_type:complete
MTVLSENLKIIRKRLGYTQIALSEVLEIGFRTYVRYEAGERDAPISVLVKLARLGNVSLDRLLTTKIYIEDLQTPDRHLPLDLNDSLEVIGGGLEEGRLMLKGLLCDHLISKNKEEKQLLALFRQMNPTNKKKFLLDAEWIYTNTRKSSRYHKPRKISRKEEKAKNAVKLRKLAKFITKTTVHG